MSTAAIDEFRTPRPIPGWRVVLTAFCMALVAWGLGFYSLSVYVQYLSQSGRFSAPLLSLATTWYFLAGAGALYLVDAAARRIGRRATCVIGVLLIAGSVCMLPHVTGTAALFAAYTGMALGWSAISGPAIAQIIGEWFQRRHGLALNLALTGASAAGVMIVPALVALIDRIGLASGLLIGATLLALGMIALMAFNLVHPVAQPQPGGSPSVAGGAAAGPGALPAALRFDRHLGLLCALFAIGWLAQVAFLALQLPLLVPKVGHATATAGVAVVTASSLLGRLLLASIADRIDHRRATAACFGLQAVGSLLMLLSNDGWLVLAGCALVGASVGNVITLPAIIAQREFAAAHHAAVVRRIWSIGQVLFAFGPLGAGLLQSATGSPQPVLAACLACQLLAALLCLWRVVPAARLWRPGLAA